MPEIKHFVVTQTREVKVTANDIESAVRIAEAAFTHGQMTSEPSVVAGKSPAGIWGNTRSFIREIELNVREGHS